MENCLPFSLLLYHLILYTPYHYRIISASHHIFSSISIAGKTYFIAVANTGLIYLSSDGGARFAAAKTVRGSLTGDIHAHDVLPRPALYCSPIHCPALHCTSVLFLILPLLLIKALHDLFLVLYLSSHCPSHYCTPQLHSTRSSSPSSIPSLLLIISIIHPFSPTHHLHHTTPSPSTLSHLYPFRCSH